MAGHKINSVTSHDNDSTRIVMIEHEAGDGRKQSMYLHVDKRWTADDVVNALTKRGYIKKWGENNMTLEGVARYARDFVEEAFATSWWQSKPGATWEEFLIELTEDGFDDLLVELVKVVPPWRFAVAYAKMMERSTDDFREEAAAAFIRHGKDGYVNLNVGKHWGDEISAIVMEYKEMISEKGKL